MTHRRDIVRQQVYLAIFLIASALPGVSRGEEHVPFCDRHPLITEQSRVVKAHSEDRGLREFHERAFQVAVAPDTGGGACADRKTAIGKAAAAVGAILYSGQRHCSGVLIAPSTVLTAAHCLRNFDTAKMKFVVGDSTESYVQGAEVLKVGYAPDYDPTRLGLHDIGYLHLKRKITVVEPVRFQRLPLKSLRESRAMHVGFGIAGSQPGVKRCVEIPISETCDDAFSNQTEGLNTCHGDSGGGVFVQSGDEVRLAGITTWGDADCQEYGVSQDVGSYRLWLSDWISSAEDETLLPARVERNGRKAADPAKLEDIRSALKNIPFSNRQRQFETLFQGKWVRWEGHQRGFPEATRLRYPESCDLVLEKEGLGVFLLGLELGCDLRPGSDVAFEGRLLSFGDDYFEIAEPELTREVRRASSVGGFRLVYLETPPIVSERRSYGFRLESHHGDGSGRVENCETAHIERPWKVDRSQPIGVAIAYQNHAGFAEPKVLTDQEICIPLWAEGFGGVRLGSLTVDAGNKGVISGSISFTVFHDGDAPVPTEVRSGTLSAGIPVQLPLLDPEKNYKLFLKLADGREIETDKSLDRQGIKVEWDRVSGMVKVTVESPTAGSPL